jgi:hypothetical protein
MEAIRPRSSSGRHLEMRPTTEAAEPREEAVEDSALDRPGTTGVLDRTTRITAACADRTDHSADPDPRRLRPLRPILKNFTSQACIFETSVVSI